MGSSSESEDLKKGKERKLIGYLKNQERERMKHLSLTPPSPTLQWLTLPEEFTTWCTEQI